MATTVALLTYIGFIFLTGMLSDRFGRKRVLISASILFIVLTVPAFMLLDTGNFLVIVLVQILLGAMLTLNDGTLPSFLAEMFPTRVRYTGFAVSFNLSNALFGGTAPFVATLLIATSGSELAPAWYLMAAAVVSLVAVCLRRGNQQEAAGQAATDFSSCTPHQTSTPQENIMTITPATATNVSELERLKTLHNGDKAAADLLRRRVRAPPVRAAPDHGRQGPRRRHPDQLPRHQVLLRLPVHHLRPQLRPGRHRRRLGHRHRQHRRRHALAHQLRREHRLHRLAAGQLLLRPAGGPAPRGVKATPPRRRGRRPAADDPPAHPGRLRRRRTAWTSPRPPCASA